MSSAASVPGSGSSALLVALALALAGACSNDGATLPCPVVELTRFAGCAPDAGADDDLGPSDATGEPAPADAAADGPDAPDVVEDGGGTDTLDAFVDFDTAADDPSAEGGTDTAPDAGGGDVDDDAGDDPDAAEVAEEPDAGGPCPADMELVGTACMDRFEAPNVAGALPLVMYTYYEAQDWCEARGRRLCFDDEWTTACEGAAGTAYPYGATHVPGTCNDEETWRLYDQSLLNLWPLSAASPTIDSLDELLAAARAAGSAGTSAADHVEWLYQGEGAGTNAGCVNETGVYDLVGNVEEWTTRRDGGDGPDFSGNLKGRYWAESRTCQGNVRVHANPFRFYEIGFRCCLDADR